VGIWVCDESSLYNAVEERNWMSSVDKNGRMDLKYLTCVICMQHYSRSAPWLEGGQSLHEDCH
jgi:hypothetical protein